jgi:hypothetical protein
MKREYTVIIEQDEAATMWPRYRSSTAVIHKRNLSMS